MKRTISSDIASSAKLFHSRRNDPIVSEVSLLQGRGVQKGLREMNARMSMNRGRFLELSTITTLTVSAPGSITPLIVQPTTTTGTRLDGECSGRIFDGVGGLSGVVEPLYSYLVYPIQQQCEILKYLFKPNYVASLHILLVEIGYHAKSPHRVTISLMTEQQPYSA